VEIQGRNFAPSTNDNVVRFGEITATVIEGDESYLIVNVPASAKSARITVKTSKGKAISKKIFKIIGKPIITKFSPESGSPRDKVIIRGAKFCDDSLGIDNNIVKFGDVEATEIINATEKKLICLVPEGANTGKISITTPAGTATSIKEFSVNEPSTTTTTTTTTSTTTSTIVNIPIEVQITPSSLLMTTNLKRQFQVAVKNTTNTNVLWSVNDIDGGDSYWGTISDSGLFTAPVNIPSPSTVTIKATSQEDPTKFAIATVEIIIDTEPPDTVITSPSSGTMIWGTNGIDITYTATDNVSTSSEMKYYWRAGLNMGSLTGEWKEGYEGGVHLSGFWSGWAYRVEIKAVDSSGNEDQTPAYTSFTLTY